MKLLKIKIKMSHDDVTGVTHHEYPSQYDAKKIQVMGYGEGCCIGWVMDVDAPKFLGSSDIVEVNRDQAVTDLEKWMPQVAKITDQDKVIQICAKAARGQIVSQEEKDALDPDNPASGINKTRPVNEIVDELLARTDLD